MSDRDRDGVRLSLLANARMFALLLAAPFVVFSAVMILKPETFVPIVSPFVMGGVIVGGLVFMFLGLGGVIGGEPDWVAKNEPLIPMDELPKHVKAHGILVKDFWQSPGNVTYSDGSLTFLPQLGKEHSIDLANVRSVRFTNGLNGKIRPGMYGVNLRVKGHARIGFSITDVEPWRSILLHHVELDSKQTS